MLRKTPGGSRLPFQTLESAAVKVAAQFAFPSSCGAFFSFRISRHFLSIFSGDKGFGSFESGNGLGQDPDRTFRITDVAHLDL